jgi:formylglycine-generating enzyme required for sulfatase activity
MQTARTFLDAGWDFAGETANGTENIWWINEGKDYPRLRWQGPAGIVFVDIPAGTFQMGDHDGAGGGDERPVHTVTLDGFQMSKYETTNGQYAQYLNAAMADGLIQVVTGVVYASSDANLAQAYCDTYTSSPYSQIEYSQGRFTVRSRDGKAMSDHPVARVSWYGGKAFCDYYGCRLPTEAEWEYAARGGYHDPYYQYPWGSNSIACSEANCKTDSGFCNPLSLTSWPYTTPVGYYGPQGVYGLCDMSGNLWEWCQDWYDSSYYSVSPASNPTGPTGGTTRVLRGGAWDVHGDSCTVAGRSVADPLVRGQVVGFRVCR